MKAGWQVRPLSEIADCCLGKMLDQQKNRGEPQPYLRNVNVRWFAFDLSDLLEMPFEVGESERYSIRKGDLVICEGGYPGRCAIWQDEEPIFFQKALHRVRCHDAERAKWVQYFLWMSDADGSLRSHFTGSGIQHLTGQALARLKVPLPPLEEQRRIVAVLDEAFEAIAAATANAEKNLANARDLFVARVRETFANPEQSWERMTLKEAALDFGRGKSKHRPRNDPKLYGGDYPFIQTGDVRNCDHMISEYSQTYSAAGLAQSKLWPEGTICITIAANIAETGILSFDACFPDSVIGMVVDPAQTSNSYVEYLLQSLKAVLQAKGKGSAQANINLATFENERFPFPPKAVQLAIVERLGALSEQVQTMETLYADKLAALNALKQSLLHRAFTGELNAIAPDLIAA